jgi:hypothetical protein
MTSREAHRHSESIDRRAARKVARSFDYECVTVDPRKVTAGLIS